MPKSPADTAALEADLRARISGEVRFDDGSRALYSTDASNYRQVPIGVVLPRTVEEVIEAVAVCRRHDAPVLARGGGTSLAGQCCNVAVVIDTSKYLNRVLEVDAERRRGRVEPGTILDDLRHAAERHHLTFGPDPATHNHCTLGGMIGNNSCGVHSVMAGRTDENVLELEVLTYDGVRLRVGPTPEDELARIVAEGGRRGEIYSRLRALRDRYAPLIRERYPDIPRRVSGYNFPALLSENGFNVAQALVGSEGTCAIVLEATTRLVDSPRERTLVVLAYPDVFLAADDVPFLLESKPIALEGMDDLLVEDMKRRGLHPERLRMLPAGRGWLLVEFGGATRQESDERGRSLMDRLQRRGNGPNMRLYSREDAMIVWKVRESALGATANVPGRPLTWEGWEDAAVAPERLGRYLRDLRRLLEGYGYYSDLYGHFGQGCVHTRISFDLQTASGIRTFRSFVYEGAALVARHGGSISGEHGDGQARGELLPIMFGEELVQAFRDFKSIWDPAGRMNPGKLIDAYRVDDHLRLGTSWDPPHRPTHFGFPQDHGSLARATLRCVGVGECRRMDGGVMCPSFMVTREEKHSTRGRARVLFEMLNDQVVQGGWRDEHVKEALDLCLACKGCKSDCPVGVDMATYKAEFLAHYYEGRVRPAAAYSMGLIHWWARLAALAPAAANAAIATPPLAAALKFLGGIAPERRLPRFAARTFKRDFRARERPYNGRRVLLWADTFTNHFHPAIATAAVEALEAAGCQVVVLDQTLCCGRPLYDWGMLDLAKRLLNQALAALRPEIAAGTPIVVLEPSCAAVFRDEAPNLLAQDEDARRLPRQTYTLGEFLSRQARDRPIGRLEQPVVFHGHCHQKAVIGTEGEKDVLRRLGGKLDVLEAGCCGMAGSFGFEKDKYEISMRIGERVLLPAVRRAAADAVIVADGFSCREQIAQGTGRQALHLAEVLRLARA
ncbi:MAG TPA: FAD-binding and (Fe-S)-binding domain-containing protein [Vicinamibacteria bacterium]|nr:FAD-binding and (Fe-S)-binding domain-containing protein [Vicinamibacteria bacterium]